MTPVRKETGYFKSFDGTRIYYEVRGEGAPIVMVYGIGCLMNHWQQQTKYFSQKYKTILFDFRAHHKSDLPQDREQLSVDALARDLHGLMNHLDLPQASFWGHSFGAQVLLRSYDIDPRFFHNLVFINGFAHNPIAGMFGSHFASDIFRLVKSGFDLAPETISYMWQKVVNNPLSIQASALMGGFNLNLTHLKDIEIYLKGIATIDLGSFIHLFEKMMSYDGRPVFDRIAAPTLIICGKNDSVTPRKFQDEMHIKIKSSEFLEVPYGTHCTQLDMPDLVNLRIEKFLTSVKFGGLAKKDSPR